MDNNGIWVGDLEANGLLDTATQIWCGVFKEINTGEIRKFLPVPFVGGDPNYLSNMVEFLDTIPTLIMHNGLQYDLPLLEQVLGYKYRGELKDTLVWSRMLKPKRPTPYHCPIKNRPHSVEVWGYRVGRGKPDHKDWSQFSTEMLHRCTEDVEIQHLIYNELLKEMEGYDWQFASWLNGRLFQILGMQERQGWLVDKEWMQWIIRTTTRWIRRIDRVLIPRLPYILDIDETKIKGEYKYVKMPFKKDGNYNSHIEKWFLDTSRSSYEAIDRMYDREVGGPFSRVTYRQVNPASNMEVKNYLLSVGWEPKDWNTDKDGKRTSPKLSKDDPFEGVEGREGNLFAKRVQISHRKSSVEGLLKLIRPDGRIASRVANIAETGRVTHAGIVNIPNMDAFLGPWMRRIFVCPSDKELVSVDSAGCQNRMLAARVGDPKFTDIMLNGKKEDKSTLHYVNLRNIHEAGYTHVPYTMAKNINFAFMFGGQDPKLGKMVKGTPADGAKVREAMLKVSTEFGPLIERLQEEWRSHAKTRPDKWGRIEYFDGWIRGLDGRPIFIDSEHKILVYMLQSDEAIMMALAYVFLYDWCEERGWIWGDDWAYVCWMHDEYTGEVKPDIAEEWKYLGEQAITTAGEYLKIACPHVGEGKRGRNWSEVH